MAGIRLIKPPAAGQLPTSLPSLPDVQTWELPIHTSKHCQVPDSTPSDPAWLAFASPTALGGSPAPDLGPAGPRTAAPSHHALRAPPLSRTASATSDGSDDGPEWSIAFSSDGLTAQALAGRRGRSRGRRSQAGSPATSRVAVRSRVRVWADVPPDEEVFDLMAAALGAHALPAVPASLHALPYSATAAPRGRRAHPLTLEPSPAAAWDFERLFDGKRHGPDRADPTHARWQDEQVPGPPGSGGEGEGGTAGQEARRRRAAERLAAMARHFEAGSK